MTELRAAATETEMKEKDRIEDALQATRAARVESRVRPVEERPPAVERPSIWHSRWWILFSALAAGALAGGISLILPPTFETSARVRIVLQPITGATRDTVLASNEFARQYAELADGPPVIAATARRLGVSPGDLSGEISAGTVGDQNLVTVTAQAGSPGVAAARANAAADAFTAYIERVNAREATEFAESVKARLAPLESEIARARAAAARATRAALSAPPSRSAATNAVLASKESYLATLLSERQRILADLAQGVAAAQPRLQIVARANPGAQVQPRPVLYGLVAFLGVGLIAAQIVAAVRRRAEL